MNPISLSDGEWKIMNHLWDKAPQTIMELTAGLQEETGWDKHTVITMLGRMEKKVLFPMKHKGAESSFIRWYLKMKYAYRKQRDF